MVMAISLILVGFVLLTISAEYAVMGSVAIAKRLKIPTLIIGLTVVAFGTSAPEFVVSIKAAFQGSPGIAMGNIVGSNIVNIALILGITSLIYPIVSKKHVLSVDYVILFLVTVLFSLFCLLGRIVMWQGLLFIAIMAAFIYYNYKSFKEDKVVEEINSAISNKSWVVILLVTAAGFVGIVYGSEILVTGAVDLARLLGVSETIIGLTIIAVGTSLPELATSVVAAVRRQNDIALGNIVGSNIWNILFIVGVTTTFVDIDVPKQLIIYDVWVMCFVTALFLLFIWGAKKIDRKSGILLILVYVLYIISQILITKGILVVS